MYVSPNVKSKAELRRKLAAGERITVLSPGPFLCPRDGIVSVEGPHSPEPHKWYGRVEVKNGVVVRVV